MHKLTTRFSSYQEDFDSVTDASEDAATLSPTVIAARCEAAPEAIVDDAAALARLSASIAASTLGEIEVSFNSNVNE